MAVVRVCRGVGVRSGALAAVAVVFAALAPSAQAAFLPPASYPVGAAASAFGFGDYTGDGIPDLAVARPSENDVVIFPGTASGRFGPALPAIPVGPDPVAVSNCIAADSYRDGNLTGPLGPVPDYKFGGGPEACDLVVSLAGSDEIAVLSGRGDGTFSKPILIPVDGTPGAVTITDLSYPAIVFAEPEQNRLGVITPSETQPETFSGPTYTDVGTDPVALASAPGLTVLGNMNSLGWPVYVADAGSNDVRMFDVRPVGLSGGPGPYVLSEDGEWQVGDDPDALAVGSFGAAVADRGSGDVRIVAVQGQPAPGSCQNLGGQPFPCQGENDVPVQSPPIPVGNAPVALATMTDPGGVPYGDLAVLDQADGVVTILRQSPSSGNWWPDFTQQTLSVPGDQTALLAWPLRAEVNGAGAETASPSVTDLALLDPGGNVSVVLQDAPRLVLTPSSLHFPDTRAGGSSTASLSVSNAGQTSARVDHFSIPLTAFGRQAFSLIDDTCSGATLPPGQTCTAVVRFTPTALGSWEWPLTAYSGTAESSAFAGIDFNANAYMNASVTAPAGQALTDVVHRGLRAIAKCSAACSMTVRALLAPNHGTTALLGTGHVRLGAGRAARLHIPLRALLRRLKHMRHTDIVVRAVARTTRYDNRGSKTVSITVKQVSLRLVGAHR
jgi:hypothetical protein